MTIVGIGEKMSDVNTNLSERLGHATVSFILDTYSHVVPGLQEAAALKFDDLFPASNPQSSVV